MFFEVPRSNKAEEPSPEVTSDETSWTGSKKRKVKDQEEVMFPPRTSKACDRCRVKKTRCLADVDGTACKKCKREGAICTFAQESKPDTKARSSPAYVQMLEGERRILIQALRELSVAKGDISTLNPNMRVAIEKLQLHNIVPKAELQSQDSQVNDSRQQQHANANGEPYQNLSVRQQSTMPKQIVEQPIDLTYNFPYEMYDSSGLPAPQYLFTQDEMAEMADLNFRDYPLDELFGVSDNVQFPGGTG